MDPLQEALNRASATDRTSYRPVFYRLPEDRDKLLELLERPAPPQVYDHLHGQLMELVRALHPQRRHTPEELKAAALAHPGDTPLSAYGVWVHYPWSDRLVHLLDEAEFALVRTDRNRNKITRAEQDLLATKRIGVIGLSVGQSVGLALAMERSFGELRLADFDTLDLSNLNRIRSGVHELGTPKVVNVAREIAEIDPFLKVTLYPQGITPDNINDFLTTGGKLDMLVEECDSVDVKIMARQRARALGIPVVMDTSDRGLLDIERFDVEPSRPILHGLVEHLDLAAAGRARTSEEKLPFVMPMLGLENLSPRMKASMLEIENTITTWPQLASSVIMGGGMSAHVIRRILLGEEVRSGRWWLDPDDMLAQEPSIGAIEQPPGALEQPPSTTVAEGPVPDISHIHLPSADEALDPSEFIQLAKAGALAPSGGNAQPWRFMHQNGRMLVFLDRERAASALDPGLRYAHFAMGACVENILLEAARSGLEVDLQHRPVPTDDTLVASLTLRGRGRPGLLPPGLAGAASQLSERCTNRRASAVLELGAAEATALVDGLGADVMDGIHVVRDRAVIDHIAELTGRAERIRFLNTACHHDMFVKEMRWDRAEAERTRDGIDIDTLELPLADRVGLRVASDTRAMGLLRGWGGAKAIEKLTARGVRASSALAVVSVTDLDVASTFAAGRAMQRFWLNASAMDILAHPVGAAIFMGLHGRFDSAGLLSPEEHAEAATILDELGSLIDTGGREAFFLFRLGRATGPTTRSLRRPLNELILPAPTNTRA
jgi:hypothetical protein